MEKKKGTIENPYSFDEYLELIKKDLWMGGYVDFGGGVIKEIPIKEKDNPGSSGSGSGDGSGNGSGSDDRPQYMVSPGSVEERGYIITWSFGIAAPSIGTGCSNKDGFVCTISVRPALDSNCKLVSLTSSFTWTAPYTAMLNAKYSYTVGNSAKVYLAEIPEFSFTIPSIYYEHF